LNIFRVGLASFLAFYIARLVSLNIYRGDLLVLTRLEQLFVPLVLAALLYILFCTLMGVSEVRDIFRRVFGKTVSGK
jgi:hypothetical protein